MRFRVEEEVFELFPQFCRGIVTAAGIDNSRTSPDLERLLKEQQEQMRADPQSIRRQSTAARVERSLSTLRLQSK